MKIFELTESALQKEMCRKEGYRMEIKELKKERKKE
jgi:hypothetical protein